MTSAIQIDGSQGEGGGQILRTSLSLAVLTGRAVEIDHIRAGRSKPGLQPQHLAAVRAAATLSVASLEGAAVGSTRLRFVPNTPASPGSYHFDIGTAGAATLVMQTVLLPLAFVGGPSRVTVTGGTHVPHAPTADYLDQVFGAVLSGCGLDVLWETPQAGFFPRGGGEVNAVIRSEEALRPVDLAERGPLLSLSGRVVTSRLSAEVGQRGVAALETVLKTTAVPKEFSGVEMVSPGPGAAVFLLAEYEAGRAGFSAVGARGKPMESVVEEACAAFRSWHKSGAACDEHLSDQLALPMALIPAESRWSTPFITDHLRTVLSVIGAFLPIQFTLEEKANGTNVVSLHGVDLLQVIR